MNYLDISILVIESILGKFKAEKKWVLQAIDQIEEDDIIWSPTPESNSIANLISHIRGTVHQRIETIFSNTPDTRDREKEFERGLVLSKEQTLTMASDAFDIIIQYLEHLYKNPKVLISQPYIDFPPLTNSAVNNQTTVINLMVQMVREIHTHTGQIMYIAKMRKGPLKWQHD
jgi:hypothetical protein